MRVQSQPLLAVRDVEASSVWYQKWLGLSRDHGGPEYERLTSGGALVLPLHRWDVTHHHGAIGDPNVASDNGVLLWFGEVAEFDEVVRRTSELDADVVLGPLRNPPEETRGRWAEPS